MSPEQADVLERAIDRAELEKDEISERPQVCLSMIVRDEAEVIERCLSSVAGIAEAMFVIDTGSEDGTLDLVTCRPRPLGHSVHVCERPWVNFGANRSELYAAVRDVRAGEYMLLLDADMELNVRGPLPELTADAYMIEIEGDPSYRLPLLVRADLPWYSVGVVHEALTCDVPYTVENLDAFTVIHHLDGGHRPEKFERDRELLTAELRGSARWVFYLAQTERDLGNRERAAALYLERARLGGGWEQEVYVSLWQAGMLRDDLGLLLEAWAVLPERLEAAYEIAWRLREKGSHGAVLELLKRVKYGAAPDGLFVNRWVWEWGLAFEYALAVHSTSPARLARKTWRELLKRGVLPDLHRAQAESNLAALMESRAA